MGRRILLLGGTAESRRLGEHLGRAKRHQVLVSFAGRTKSLRRPDVPYRIGGFGGAEGLADFIVQQHFDTLVDATHPFAANITRNAAHAAGMLPDVQLLHLQRPAWRPEKGDHWIHANDMPHAVQQLGDSSRRVLLAIGRLEVGAFRAAPHHHYLWRTVDHTEAPTGIADIEPVVARGPFTLAGELALLRKHRIDTIVSKNAGSPSTYAKIQAARELRLAVVMIQRPRPPSVPHSVATVERALAWLDAGHP